MIVMSITVVTDGLTFRADVIAPNGSSALQALSQRATTAHGAVYGLARKIEDLAKEELL